MTLVLYIVYLSIRTCTFSLKLNWFSSCFGCLQCFFILYTCIQSLTDEVVNSWISSPILSVGVLQFCMLNLRMISLCMHCKWLWCVWAGEEGYNEQGETPSHITTKIIHAVLISCSLVPRPIHSSLLLHADRQEGLVSRDWDSVLFSCVYACRSMCMQMYIDIVITQWALPYTYMCKYKTHLW